MAQPDLEQIIDGCRKGQQDSYAQLVDIYSKRCFAYFYRLTGKRELSEDLLSELFVKLVEKIGTYRGGSFDGWIFTMASNIFHDYLRFKQRQTRLIDEQVKREKLKPAGFENAIDEDADKLQTALGKLDNDVRELVMMRYYSQLSFKEISEARHEPIGTVLSKVHRGLKKLRELMGQ
jgi:RNA polymerase sigma-70 factor (ECF subfamily)